MSLMPSMPYQLLPTQDEDELPPTRQSNTNTPSSRRRAFFIRSLALLCACSLSIGSHYGSYFLGPIKSRLSKEMGTSNTEFSLLLSAFTLNSTWTPLLGGILTTRLGTTITSVLATGVVFLGQILLLIGDLTENVRLMTFGMFVFGLGLSPLSVVQETIIVRFFKSHGLGVSLALGLVAGKGTSFISARTSYPLTQKFGSRAPFFVATALAGLSVLVNVIYVLASKCLIEGAGVEPEARDIQEEIQKRNIHNVSEEQALKEVAAKHHVNLRDIAHLGDVFWAYVGINVLCGTIWSPFTHLSSNIIELRYNMSELEASTDASYLLAGSVIFYPLCGFLVDRVRHRLIILHLFLLSSCLTLLCYVWFVLPPNWTQTPLPGISLFAAGHGFSPLLLVVIVPQLVPLKFVSTALGAHKSLEHAGSTLFQTLVGWLLDRNGKTGNSSFSMQALLNTFLFLNVLQFLAIFGLYYLYRQQGSASDQDQDVLSREQETRLSSISSKSDVVEEGDEEGLQLLGALARRNSDESVGSVDSTRGHEAGHRRTRLNSRVELSRDYHPRYLFPAVSISDSDRTEKERRVKRGMVFAALCCVLIVLTWALFLVTAWLRLRTKQERGGNSM